MSDASKRRLANVKPVLKTTYDELLEIVRSNNLESFDKQDSSEECISPQKVDRRSNFSQKKKHIEGSEYTREERGGRWRRPEVKGKTIYNPARDAPVKRSHTAPEGKSPVEGGLISDSPTKGGGILKIMPTPKDTSSQCGLAGTAAECLEELEQAEVKLFGAVGRWNGKAEKFDRIKQLWLVISTVFLFSYH